MLIGNDHASIALVTLDKQEGENEQRGRLLRALARSHALAAASGGAPKGAPAVKQNSDQPETRIALAERPANRPAGPLAVAGASPRQGNDALRRALIASHKATALRDDTPRLALRPDGPTSVLGKRAHIPWRDFQSRHVPNVVQQQRPGEHSSGPKLLLLCEPISPPEGFTLRVRALTGPGGAREAALRLKEAERIVPMLPEYVWLHVLGEDATSLATWPAGKLAGKQLNATANMEGANTLAKWRCTFVHLTLFLRAEYGRGVKAFDRPVGASILQEWLEGWEDGAVAVATAKAAASGVLASTGASARSRDARSKGSDSSARSSSSSCCCSERQSRDPSRIAAIHART